MSHQLQNHFGGWVPQKPDARDHEFIPQIPRQSLPRSYALDVSEIPILDQGQQGSCVGHGVAGIVMVDQQIQGEPVVVPAREFVYYNARVYEGTADQDAGAEVRDGVKVVAKLGVPPDTDFPYNDQVFNVRPPQRAYDDAVRQEALVYQAVLYPHLNAAIASGYPFVFGFTVYESFESDEVARTGVVPVPERGEQVLGGHCVYAWGYNARTSGNFGRIPPRTKACRNSWGPAWADNGNFYLPQWYFDSGQTSDAWVIRRLGTHTPQPS